MCSGVAGTDCGGGLYARTSSLLLRDCMIRDNTSGASGKSDGGGVYVWEVLSSSPGVRIESTHFVDNRAPGDGGSGGGLFVYSLYAPLVVTDCVFQRNESDWTGGGMEVYNWSGVQIEDTEFVGNASQSKGGGAFFGLNTAGPALAMDRVRFHENEADDATALRLEVSLLHIPYAPRDQLTNVVFSANRSDTGSVVHARPSRKSLEVELAHVTAAYNEAPVFLYASTAGSSRWLTATLTNTLLVSSWVAYRGSEGSGEVFIRHTNSMTDQVIALHASAGGSPTFEAVSALTGDAKLDGTYHLRPGSAAIDAGVDAGVDIDIDGDPRATHDGFDIGADEFTTYPMFLPLVQRGH